MPSIGLADKETLDRVETKVGANTNAGGTTTMFARLKQIYDYLASNLSTTRAAKIDNLNATISSRATPDDIIAPACLASDTLQVSSDTEKIVDVSEYTKMKEIVAIKTGFIRVSFALKSSSGYSGNTPVYGKLYKNGIAIGTERSCTDLTYKTYTEDIRVDPGDFVQLYCKGRRGATFYEHLKTRNFRIYYTDHKRDVITLS